MQESRLFKIVYHLLDKGRATASELAEKFEVSVRTIYRDIDALSGAGIPIYAEAGRNGGIYLMNDFVMDKAVLTEEEKREILTALHSINSTSNIDNSQILQKLSAIFNVGSESWLEVDFSRWGNNGTDNAKFELLKSAVIQQRCVKITYANSNISYARRVIMEQQKIGNFLKQLRKEKGLTQEQFAERFYISSRTVSRWETGSNMPDVDMLIELADFYEVDIREIIDGERKSENMDNETKATLKKVAKYATEENQKRYKRLSTLLAASIALGFVCYLLFGSNYIGVLYGTVPEDICDNITSFTSGLTAAGLVLYFLHLLGAFDKVGQWKKKCRENKR